MDSEIRPEAWEVLPWDDPEADPLEDLSNAAQRLCDNEYVLAPEVYKPINTKRELQ